MCIVFDFIEGVIVLYINGNSGILEDIYNNLAMLLPFILAISFEVPHVLYFDTGSCSPAAGSSSGPPAAPSGSNSGTSGSGYAAPSAPAAGPSSVPASGAAAGYPAGFTQAIGERISGNNLSDAELDRRYGSKDPIRLKELYNKVNRQLAGPSNGAQP